MTDLLRQVRVYIDRHGLVAPGQGLVVGVSGGADSLCLLHLLHRLAAERALDLHVAHLNHSLRGTAADADARYVAEIAAAWGLPFTGETLPPHALEAVGASLEEAARKARYAFLVRVARHVGAQLIAVGHNADDQAETVLMHFLRGSGINGLRGMAPQTHLADDPRVGATDAASLLLIRPLLATFRAEIEAYCQAHDLSPRRDVTNADVTFYRNRLRHELLPVLATYNPRIRSVLQHTASVMAGDHEVLSRATAQAWDNAVLNERGEEIHFRLSVWRALPVGLQRSLVREAIARLRLDLRNIGWEHVERGVMLGREGQTGGSATLAGGLVLHLRADRLVIGPELLRGWAAGPRLIEPVALSAPGVLPLRDGWRVEIQRVEPADLPAAFDRDGDPWQAYVDADVAGCTFLLRPRRAGDRFQPLGLGGRRARVNEFMINAKIPREDRATWPVLTAEWGVVWLCGLRLDERAAVRAATTHAWCIRFVKG